MDNNKGIIIPSLTKKQKKSRRKRRFLRTFVIVVGILVMIRIALPFVIMKVINKKLEVLPNYTLVVNDISLNLIGQSITLKDIEMRKKNGKIEVPLFTCDVMDVYLQSLKKKTVKVVIETVKINLVKGKNKEETQMSIDQELKDIIADIPLKPDILILKHADVHFIENYRSPNIDLALTNISIDGRNMENYLELDTKYPSKIKVIADLEGGKLDAVVKLNQQKKNPLVNIVASLKPFQVARAKNLLKVYADLDVDSGTLSAKAIINMYDGRIDGFIDPVAKNLVFHKTYDKEKVKLGKRMKQRLLNGVSKLLGKDEEEKIETRIELHGPMDNVKIDIWTIITEGLKNSFLVGSKKED